MLKKEIKQQLKKGLFSYYKKSGLSKNNGKSRIRKIFRNEKLYEQFDSIFEIYEGKNVLDVGCNIGYFSAWVSCYAKTVYGIDIDDEYIRQSHNLRKAIGRKSNISIDNFSFSKFSAFELDMDYLQNRNIDAVLLHKVSGYWPLEEENKFWQLCVDAGIDTIVININNEKEFLCDILTKNGYKMDHSNSLFSVIRKVEE